VKGYTETLITAQGPGAALTAAAAASLLPAQAKLPLLANFWEVAGQQIEIEAGGKISSVITTPGTARFDVRIGGVVVWDSLAILLDTVAAHVNVGWRLRVKLTCRAVGATGNLFGVGLWTCEDLLGTPATAPKGSLTAILPWNAAPAVGANFDTGAAGTLDLFFTQTVATGSITLEEYDVTRKN
jgi:hypothetical protein